MESQSSSENGWWDGWMQAAKEKTANVVDFMKRDLGEFACVVHQDTATVVASTATTVKDKLNSDSSAVATAKVKEGLSSILGKVASAMYIPPDDEDEIKVQIQHKTKTHGCTPFDRAKARLYAIQVDPETYCSPPSGSKEEFESWHSAFNLDASKGEISELLVTKPEVRAMYTQLVPVHVSHAEFWTRYFYKVSQLEEDEKRKTALKQRADLSKTNSDEPLGWDDEDDEWGIVEIPHAGNIGDEIAMSSATAEHQKSSPTNDTEDSSASAQAKPTVCDSTIPSRVDSNASDSTVHPDTAEKTDPASLGSQTAVDVAEPSSHAEASTIAADDNVANSSQSALTAQDHAPSFADEMNEIHMKDREDMVVVVGQGISTPSSGSTANGTRDTTSLDDDWEKDFDDDETVQAASAHVDEPKQTSSSATQSSKGAENEGDDWEDWE